MTSNLLYCNYNEYLPHIETIYTDQLPLFECCEDFPIFLVYCISNIDTSFESETSTDISYSCSRLIEHYISL